MAILEREISAEEFIKRRPLSTKEYFDLAELGAFDGERVELIDGNILTMAPIGNDHRGTVTIVTRKLINLFDATFSVTTQSSYKLGDGFVPEPDFAIFKGTDREFAKRDLPLAELIVEVSHSSLAYDRTIKSRVYGQAGIPEYWIVNLIDLKIEVYREPTPEGYSPVTDYLPGQSITPLCLPTGSIMAADLLP